MRYSSTGTSGLSIIANEAIEPDETIVSLTPSTSQDLNNHNPASMQECSYSTTCPNSSVDIVGCDVAVLSRRERVHGRGKEDSEEGLELETSVYWVTDEMSADQAKTRGGDAEIGIRANKGLQRDKTQARARRSKMG